MTAAHRALSFGTMLVVQSGGRSMHVTVNDRHSFTGAFLDLLPPAASALVSLSPPQDDRGARANRSRRDRILEPRSSTARCWGSHDATLSTNARQDVTGALGTHVHIWRCLRRY